MDEKTIMESIGKLEKEELLKIIGLMAEVSGSAKRALVNYCRVNVKAKDGQSLDEQLLQHWKKAQPTVEMFNTCGGGSKSDEDDILEELGIMKDLLGKGEISWKVRKEILDELLEEVASDNSGLTDVLVELAVKMCVTGEEKIYLADFLADYGNSFYKNFASELYTENSKEDRKAEPAVSGPVSSSDYMELVNKYKKQRNQELALKTAMEGLEKAEGRLFEIYGYLFTHFAMQKDERALNDLYRKASRREQDKDFITELMYGYFKEQGNYGKKKKMLYDLLACADSKKLVKWYHVCQKEFYPEDFAAEEGNVLKSIQDRNPAAYYDICIEKGNMSEVIKYLSGRRQFTKGNADAGHRISKQLAPIHPREIVDVYWKEAYFYAEIGGQEECRYAVSVLREINEIMEKNSWTEEWNERYNDFIRDSISNPVMISELARF